MNRSLDPDDSVSVAAQECAAIAADLQRLRLLLADAGTRLLASFDDIAASLPATAGTGTETALARAVTALQFQDLAEQLTAHAQRRLALLEGCLNELSMGETAGLAHERQQPVGQQAMSAGTVELF